MRRTARRAGINKAVTPHTLRHAFAIAALAAGVPLRDVHEAASHADPRTTMRYDRARGSLDLARDDLGEDAVQAEGLDRIEQLAGDLAR